ncbi:MAG: FAD-binding protein, partial [Chloroflexi bacterium]
PCTPQLGRPGLWSDRLPHFRMSYTPSSGEEIQSEYLFPRRHAMGAIEAVRALADGMRPILQVSEIRRVAADQLWMSMNYEEDSVAIHFTWKQVFHADSAAIALLYKRHADFVRLVERLDPRGAFRNAWLKARVLGDK